MTDTHDKTGTPAPFTPAAGMRCVMRNGEITPPLLQYGHPVFIFAVRMPFYDSGFTFTAEGKYHLVGDSDFDLIAEAKPEEGAEEFTPQPGCPTPTVCAGAKNCINGQNECGEDDTPTIARLEAENAKLTELLNMRDAFIVQNDMWQKFTHENGIEGALAELASLRAQVEELQAAQTQAAMDVIAERKRQISVEGFDAEQDDVYIHDQLPRAAACYAVSFNSLANTPLWPWQRKWWKPKSRRYDLIRAGALILAEIERLDRAALAKSKGEG